MRVVRQGSVPAAGNLSLGRCGEFWVYDLDDIEDGDSNDDVSSQAQYDAATWKCASCADCFRVTCYEKRPSLRDWNAVPSYLDVAIRRLSHRFIAARPASHARTKEANE